MRRKTSVLVFFCELNIFVYRHETSESANSSQKQIGNKNATKIGCRCSRACRAVMKASWFCATWNEHIGWKITSKCLRVEFQSVGTITLLNLLLVITMKEFGATIGVIWVDFLLDRFSQNGWTRAHILYWVQLSLEFGFGLRI